jgi:hypothetical protein
MEGVYVYVYVYIEREREREREIYWRGSSQTPDIILIFIVEYMID